MKKSDLVAGKHIIKYREGSFRSVGKGNILLDGKGLYRYTLDKYDEKLNNIDGNKDLDIVSIYELTEVWKREETTITDDEKVILSHISGNYEWIARDKNGRLCVYPGKPSKAVTSWGCALGHRFFDLFNHLFKMVKWEDEEPWKIEDLLKLDVKKDG